MAQAFLSIYKDSYRVHPIERRKSLKPVDKVAETLPEGDLWIVPKKIGEGEEEGGTSLEEAKAVVNEMIRRRLYSVYQVSYTLDAIENKFAVDDDDEEEGVSSKIKKKGKKEDSPLMEMCKTLYKPKTQKIPPPLPTARRVYGYIRPVMMYTPVSEYQATHGKVGCGVLIANEARIREAKEKKALADEEAKTGKAKKKAKHRKRCPCCLCHTCTCFKLNLADPSLRKLVDHASSKVC